MTIKQHLQKYSHYYILLLIVVSAVVAGIMLITVFRKHDDSADRKYIDLYVAAKDSVIAEKNKFFNYLQTEISESKQTITYYKQKDSLTDLSIQQLLQKDQVLQKQQNNVTNYINSLGRNADSIRRAFHEFN